MTALLIGLFHGVPVLLAAFVFGTKTAIFITAAIMALVGGFFGDPAYMFLDWVGVAIGTFLGIMAINKTT